MDELELDLNDGQNINKSEERFTKLSSKVRETAEERDAERKAREESDAKAQVLQKERDFYAALPTHLTKFPKASEHMDEIKEKVMAGYAPEDAILAVLNAKNELMPQGPEPISVGPIAGGSVPNNLSETPVSGMTQDERRAKLIEADSKGELVEAIRAIR